MDPKAPDSELLQKIDENLQQMFTRAEERWEALHEQSNAARANFNDKLAVLNAGSIALTASAAAALYSKPFQNAWANKQGFEALMIAAVSLWLSLCLCVVHNLMEPYALQQWAEMHMYDTLVLQQARRMTHKFAATEDYLKASRASARNGFLVQQHFYFLPRDMVYWYGASSMLLGKSDSSFWLGFFITLADSKSPRS
jgi:hypothetical protein